MRKLIFALIVILGLMCADVCMAQIPTGVYYRDTNTVVISGHCEGLDNDMVNVAAIRGSELVLNDENIVYINSTQCDKNGEFEFRFTLSDVFENCSFWLKTSNEYYPIQVYKVKAENNISIPDYIELSFSCLKIPLGGREKPSIYVYDANNMALDETVDLISDNSDVVFIEDGYVYAMNIGKADVYAVYERNGKSIRSNKCTINVENVNSDVPQFVGVSLYSEGKLLESGGDISSADEVVCRFNANVNGITSVSVINDSCESEQYRGIYDDEGYTYTFKLNNNLGYGIYDFKINTEENRRLLNDTITEGCWLDCGLPKTIVAGQKYKFNPQLKNCKGAVITDRITDINCSESITINDSSLIAQRAGEGKLFVSIENDGKLNVAEMKLNVTEVSELIPYVDFDKLAIGEQKKINCLIVGTDGSVLNETDIELNYKSSNSSKIKIDENGIMTALQIGYSDISVFYENVSATVRIGAGISVGKVTAGVWFDENITVMEEGEKNLIELYEYSILRNKSAVDEVVFSVSDASVLELRENNIIIAKKTGKTVITAESNGKSYSVLITVVKKKNGSVKLITESSYLPVGAREQLIPIVDDSRFAQSYRLYSDNTNVIEIVENGIKAKSVGKANIWAEIYIDNAIYKTESTVMNVFEPSGGLFKDDLTDFSKIYEHDNRVFLTESKQLITNGTNIRNYFVKYKSQGDICGDIKINLLKKDKKNENVSVRAYVSSDDVKYTELIIKDHYVFESDYNGWYNNEIIFKNSNTDVQYLKIIMDNGEENSQQLRLCNVEFIYTQIPQVLDVKISDELSGDNLFFDILGRKAVITFDQPVNIDSIETQIGKEGYFDSERLRYVFEFDRKDYNSKTFSIVNIENAFGLKNTDYFVEITPMSGKCLIDTSEIYSVNPFFKKEKLVLKNDTTQIKSYRIINAIYKDGMLENVSCLKQGYIMPGKSENVFLDLDETKTSKLFVWESMETMSPYMFK